MPLQEYGERWVDVEGIRTRYFEAGQGEKVVLVHGGTSGDPSGGANAEDWDRNFGLLANSHHVIAIDRLGQGYTDNPVDDSGYAMSSVVSHFSGFLKALGGGPFHLVGHSRGGYVVCRTTMDFPELVRSCIIVDSNTAAPGPSRNENVFATNPHRPGSVDASRYMYEHYSWGTEHVTDEWVAVKQKIAESEKNRAAVGRMHGSGLAHTVFLPGLRYDRDVMFNRLGGEQLTRPTMIYWGYNDPTATIEQCWELFGLIAKHQPRTRLHICNQAGHHSFRERPEEFNRVITEFVDGVGYGE